MRENKSAPIELETEVKFFIFNLELVTRKRKNRGVTMDLVTRSVTFCFPTSS